MDANVQGPVSMDPADFIAGGLPDDFDGEITEVRFTKWNYGGRREEFGLAARVTIKPAEESGMTEDIVQHYSAGDLKFFAPSQDGRAVCDLASDDPKDWEGIYVLPVGPRPQLNNNSNWADFLTRALQAELPKERLSPNVTKLEGLYGHFNRVSQRKRSGLITSAEGEKEKQILVLTAIKPNPNAGKKGKAPAAGKAAASPAAGKSAADNGQEEFDGRLIEAVLGVLAENDGTIHRTKLPALVIKAFDAAEKGKAVKRLGEVGFLGKSDAWVWDADDNTLTLA